MRSPPLILIVDDNLSSLEILEARLAASGYEVITATDGAAGLAMAKDRHPDLILLDIMMPKLDGIEVCRRLKEDARLPFMPIIMVTAKTDSKDIVAGLEAGSDEYLTKPVDHAALVARVQSMLRIKALQDTVQEQSAQLKRQLKTASGIQKLFWPQMPELAGGSHIWAVSRPAAYVGGDLYDVIALPDHSVLAYVADVSGKGVPAALIMAALSTLIRSVALRECAIDHLLETVNNTFYDLASVEGFFATIVLFRFWPADGRMHLVSAGHLPPVGIAGGGRKEIPVPKSMAIGVTPDIRYQKTELQLSGGESILFFSDGVVEAENEKKELFGNERVLRHIAPAKRPPWGEGLLRAVDRWRGTSQVSDDITLLEIWRDWL
ncbi:MAG: response regulator [Desulfosarcina sp.]|nr:response regulator [Desulfobacterales bacterium]